jgi:transcriptional regulator with XRE-family HTH domain
MAANRSSPLHEATLQANWLLQRIGRELRLARIAAGMTQQQVALRLRTSKARISRVERAQVASVSISAVARHAGAVGLRLHAQLFPSARRVLDGPQIALLNRLRERLLGNWSWELEVPVPTSRDLRAVDARLTLGSVTIVVEAITRLADLQAQLRAAQLKRRDIAATRLLLLISDTNANRRALAEARPLLDVALLTNAKRIFSALEAGEDPGGDCLLVL